MDGGDIPGVAGAEHAADRAAREAAPWVERLARLGYAAKGAVYVLVGGLAVAAAVGAGGQATGSSGALATLSDSTVGRIVLVAIAVGLIGYAIWGLVRAVRDPEREGTGHRAFFAMSALLHGLVAVEAARLALSGVSAGNGAGGGVAGGSGAGGAAHWSAELMQQPFGLVLVGAVGIAIGLYGIHQLMSAWNVELDDHLAMGSMTRTTRAWTVRLGRFGLAARGLVMAIIGYYFLRSALTSSPSQARGLDEVLQAMRDTPWLLGVVALGLVAYGVYNFVRARYRVIRPA